MNNKCLICRKEIKSYPSVIRKYCSMKCMYLSPERNNKISIKKLSENNPNWKGNNAKYRAIHGWISSHYGKSNKCENDIKHKGMFVWANISGKYHRNRDDFKMLCQSCHMNEDHNKIIKSKEEYKKDLKVIKPMLDNKTPIRRISRITGINRYRVKSIAKREGYKTDFRN